MKALLVILTIFTIDTLCQGVKVSEKVYPKKYASGKILINPSKYEKAYKYAKHNNSQKATLPTLASSYTGFSNIGNHSQVILAGIPDSPYFPIDPGYHQKSSVKKVVPDHPFSLILRRKRSADVSIVPPAEKVEKKLEPEVQKAAEVQKETTQAPTAAAESIKVETTVTPSSSPKEESKSAAKIISTTKTPAERATTAKPKKKLPAPARKGQPKSKAAVRQKGKPKGKSAVVRAKPKAKKGKSAVIRAKPKAKKGKSAAVRAKPKAKKGKSAAVRAKPKAKKGKSAVVRAKPKAKKGKSAAVRAKPKAKKGKSAAVRAKPKAKKGKSAVVRAKPKVKKGKSAVVRAKPKAKPVKKNLQRLRPSKTKTVKRKRKGSNLQRSKNQKAKKPKNARTGKAPKETRTRRLTGAREAVIEDYPYVVSIQKDEQHWCSGALLSPRLVITTANCLWKANRVSRMEVRAGSRHTNRGGQVAGIQEVWKHPNWNLRKSPENDIALILLNRNIKFSNAVHGVDLPNRVMLPPFDDAWITSWGAERRDGVYDQHDSSTLQVYHARLMDRDKCNNVTMRFSVMVSENFICLAQTGRQAPCTRDTGAPAVSDGILWGLASWGIRKLCGTERYPAVFSYIASNSNMDFIMNSTRYLMSDKRQYPFPDRFEGLR